MNWNTTFSPAAWSTRRISGLCARTASSASLRLDVDPAKRRSSQVSRTRISPSTTIGCDSHANTVKGFNGSPCGSVRVITYNWENRPPTKGGVGTKYLFSRHSTAYTTIIVPVKIAVNSEPILLFTKSEASDELRFTTAYLDGPDSGLIVTIETIEKNRLPIVRPDRAFIA